FLVRISATSFTSLFPYTTLFRSRVFFNGLFGSLQSTSGMIGPLLAGTIISRMETHAGYMTIFSISFSLFLLAVVISFFLQKRETDRKSTRLNSSHVKISYAVFCL